MAAIMLVTLCSVAFAGTVRAESPQAVDPLFGLVYSTTTVRFEEAGHDILSACRELTNAGWDRQLWIFAQTSASDGKYLVLGGFFIRRHADKSLPALQTDRNGVLLRVNNSACTLLGPARDIFDYPPPDMNTAILKTLAADAADRYVTAFGSKNDFLNALSRRKESRSNSRSRILENAVSAISP
jgi:hypothetical protein